MCVFGSCGEGSGEIYMHHMVTGRVSIANCQECDIADFWGLSFEIHSQPRQSCIFILHSSNQLLCKV